jgi:hypothetical protein
MKHICSSLIIAVIFNFTFTSKCIALNNGSRSLYGCGVIAQVTDDNINNKFYQHLIIELGVDKSIPIFYKTSLTTFRRVDLTNEKLRWEGKEDVPGMTTFLNQFIGLCI